MLKVAKFLVFVSLVFSYPLGAIAAEQNQLLSHSALRAFVYKNNGWIVGHKVKEPHSIGTQTVEMSNYAIGDLNDDGEMDAAIIYTEDGGGSGVFFYLIVALNKDATLVPIRTKESLGDRVNIKRIRVKNGIILITLLTHGLNDGLGFPSISRTIQFVVSGNKLKCKSGPCFNL
jgi:hypothetical protein